MSEDRGAASGSPVVRFIRQHWLVLVALHPLVRCLLLAEPLDDMSAFQIRERYLWLSFWLIEAAVIVAALRSGMSLGAVWRTLPKAGQALLAVWLSVLVLSPLWAPHSGPAARSLSEWLTHALFVFAIGYLATRNAAEFAAGFRRFAAWAPWFAAAAGVIAAGLVYKIGIASDYNFATDLPGFAHIRHSGYLFAPVMALCIGRLATAPTHARTAWALLVANAALCLWFGSRGPFFAVVAALLLAALVSPEFRQPRFLARTAAAIVVAAVLSVLPPSPEGMGFNAVMRFLTGAPDIDAFSSGRTEFWLDALRLIAERPLLGYGGGQFQFVSQAAIGSYRHPHNFILQMLFDWGLIGGGAVLGLLALAGRMALRSLSSDAADSRTAVFGLAVMQAFAAIDGVLFYPYTIALTAVFLAVALLPVLAQARDPATAEPAGGGPLAASNAQL